MNTCDIGSRKIFSFLANTVLNILAEVNLQHPIFALPWQIWRTVIYMPDNNFNNCQLVIE